MKRKEIVVMGTCEMLAIMLAVSIAEKGYITRINAIFLVASWPIFMLLARGAIGKSAEKKDVAVAPEDGRLFYHFIVALLGFVVLQLELML